MVMDIVFQALGFHRNLVGEVLSIVCIAYVCAS